MNGSTVVLILDTQSQLSKGLKRTLIGIGLVYLEYQLPLLLSSSHLHSFKCCLKSCTYYCFTLPTLCLSIHVLWLHFQLPMDSFPFTLFPPPFSIYVNPPCTVDILSFNLLGFLLIKWPVYFIKSSPFICFICLFSGLVSQASLT